jgi:hypothetical protein
VLLPLKLMVEVEFCLALFIGRPLWFRVIAMLPVLDEEMSSSSILCWFRLNTFALLLIDEGFE